MKIIIYSFVASAMLLTGCSTGANGERVMGSPGSPIWFSTASIQTQAEYYKSLCKAYGVTENSSAMSGCIQTEMSNGRSAASAHQAQLLNTMHENQRQDMQMMLDVGKQNQKQTRCSSTVIGNTIDTYCK